MILNLGCGELLIKNAVNVDCDLTPCCDKVIDLRLMPWPWESNSVDGIYMFHFLEHFPEPLDIIKECYRVLKPGGFLFIVVPHSSLINAVGCIGHYRTFSYGTFKDYLGRAWYYNDKPMFKTEKQKLHYLDFPRTNPNEYAIEFNWEQEYNYFARKPAKPYPLPIRILAGIIQPLINLSPRAFERFWHGYVGGAHEVVWKGVKIC